MKIVDLTFSGAWAVTDRFSLGASVIYQHADVTLSNAIDFGTALCAGSRQSGPTASTRRSRSTRRAPTARVEVKGDDNSWGWIVGAQWRPTDNFSIGYSHHSKIDHTLTGDADFTVPGSVAAAFGALA